MDKAGTIEHARFSLKNVQDNIRFVDRKVGAAIAIVSFVVGFVIPQAHVGQRVLQAFADMATLRNVPIVLAVLASLYYLVKATWQAFRVMTPRSPKENGGVVLFPFAQTDCEYRTCKMMIGDKFASGMSNDEQLKEFQTQLATLGYVQGQKMFHCGKMFRSCWRLIMAMLILMILCASSGTECESVAKNCIDGSRQSCAQEACCLESAQDAPSISDKK